jgi:hypothetical protein
VAQAWLTSEAACLQNTSIATMSNSSLPSPALSMIFLKKERGWRINEQLRDFFLLIKIGMDTIFVLL